MGGRDGSLSTGVRRPRGLLDAQNRRESKKNLVSRPRKKRQKGPGALRACNRFWEK